jgi:hypothetical protein
MKRLALALAVTAGFLLGPAAADAQYRYTDDKGVTKSTQYKVDIPAPYRDAAEWVGPTGLGKPALSHAQQQWKARDEAYRRIGEANAKLVPYGGSSVDTSEVTPPARTQYPAGRVVRPRTDSKGSPARTSQEYNERQGKAKAKAKASETPTMCVAGHLRKMISPGQWAVLGECRAPSSR